MVAHPDTADALLNVRHPMNASATKLGITEQDWRDIQQLALRQKDLVIKDARKVSPDVIEVELKKSDDIHGEQGGPIERFEKKDGHWRVDPGFSGDWYFARQIDA
jgi:hypothetical protein